MERCYDINGGEWVDISDWRLCQPHLWENTVTGEVIGDDEFMDRMPLVSSPVTDRQTIYIVEDEDDC